MRITLPEGLLRFVQDRVSAGGYASARDYLCSLIAKAQRDAEREAFEQGLVDALLKEDFIDITPAFWRRHEKMVEEWLARHPDSKDKQ